LQEGLTALFNTEDTHGTGNLIAAEQIATIKLIPKMKKLKPNKGMTGKQQSNAGRSVANLGQKEAELEKASEMQLKRMTRGRTTSAPGRFIAWCKQEQASIQQQLELMETGKVLTGENRGSGCGSIRLPNR